MLSCLGMVYRGVLERSLPAEVPQENANASMEV